MQMRHSVLAACLIMHVFGRGGRESRLFRERRTLLKEAGVSKLPSGLRAPGSVALASHLANRPPHAQIVTKFSYHLVNL